ncbi:uncharacterized protein LOC105257636 [Camponotus floridanus]|uniref:uncharacterized protein LOC105257636 n=1 Tax=Camponotus floridanus TaxID=104421 RepID=UPI000DC6AE35|nr:uncharacterized protein LOC105257636 [Camponotus floridanus]
MYNKINKEHLNNWPSDTFAKEHTDKDKFNDSKITEKVAIHSEIAAEATTNNIETKQHDIHLKDRSKLEDSWNTETKIQNALSDASADMIALKQIKNKSEGKSILDNKLATLSSNIAHAKTQVIDKEKYGIMDTSDSFINAEEAQHSLTSAMSSASASISNNMNINLDTKYDQINNKMSTTSLITSVSKDNKGRKKHLSSARTSLHLSDKINGCDKDIETREFISQVSNLYKVLDKKQDSEILVMKRNSKGPVQTASLKNSVPPLIAYRLIPREVYEKICTILTNKQIFCTDCPLSNS